MTILDCRPVWGMTLMVSLAHALFAAQEPILDLSFDVNEVRTTAQTVRPALPLATNVFSVAYWVRPLDWRTNPCSSRWEKVSSRLVLSDGSGYFDGFRTGLEGQDRYRPFFSIGGEPNRKGFSAGKSIPCEQWAHVAWTWDGAQVCSYVNGEPSGSWPCTLPLTPPKDRHCVVGRTGYGMPPLPCRLETVKVWDRVLSQHESDEMTLPRFPERHATRLTEQKRWAEARAVYAKQDDWKGPRHSAQSIEPRRPVGPLPQKTHAVFVSPTGSDTAAGTKEAPLATWRAAVAAVRSLRTSGAAGGVTVFFRGGEYRVRETVELESADAGTPDFPVVYAAFPGERPVCTGADDLRVWEPVTDPAVLRRLPTEAARKSVRVCNLAAAGIDYPKKSPSFGWGFADQELMDLYAENARLLPARFPNDGFLRATNVVDKTNCVFRVGEEVGDLSVWANEPELMGCGYWVWCWADFTVPLQTDLSARTFTINPKLKWPMAASWNPNMFYFLCNALPALDREGEWCLDARAGRLYAWLPPNAKRMTVSVFDRPFLTMKGLHHVRIEGLTFTGGRGRAITAQDCSDLVFARNQVLDFGGEGVRLAKLRDTVIWGNVFKGFGYAALDISGGDRRTLTPSGIRLENNEIASSSRHMRTYTPGLRLHGCGTKVVYNHFHDILSSAMRLEGNDFLISMNLVENVVKESGDQGGVDIYNNPSYLGNIYSYNIWRNIGCHGHGQAGIRFDDRISGQVVYGNRFDDASDGTHFGGVQMNGGRRNVIDNNVFTRCAIGVSGGGYDGERWTKGMTNGEFRVKLEKQVNIYAPPYTTRYPGCETLKDEVHPVNYLERNVFVGDGVLLRGSSWNQLKRNWRFAECPDLDELARETCFDPLPPESDIGTY